MRSCGECCATCCSAPGIVVIAEAGGGREAVELTLYYKPDVVLMDLLMPGTDGIAATREILAGQPDAKVVMITSLRGRGARPAVAAHGRLRVPVEDVNIESIPRALRAASEGEAVISRRLTTRLVDTVRRTPRGRRRHPPGPQPAHRPRVGGPRPPVPGPVDGRDRATRSCCPPRPSARTSRASCASSVSARAARPSRWRRSCAAGSSRAPPRPPEADAPRRRLPRPSS